MSIGSEARRRGTAEEGFVVVAVMFLLAILVLSLAVAAPRIKKQLQRDREVEATHRGKQYIRAIQLYYRKFHAYPPNIDALVATNNLRFLRKKYTDPITGKDDWAPIHFGQNKVATTMGFFGAEIGGASIAGTGPGGPGLGLGSSGPGSSGIGTSAVSTGDPTAGGSSSSTSGSSAFSSSSGSTNSTGGQTFGGAGIIGFSIPSEKHSILVYKKQDHFNKWEFVYDPLQESLMNLGGGGAGIGGTPGTQGSGNGPPPNPGGPGNVTPPNSPGGPGVNSPPPPAQ